MTNPTEGPTPISSCDFLSFFVITVAVLMHLAVPPQLDGGDNQLAESDSVTGYRERGTAGKEPTVYIVATCVTLPDLAVGSAANSHLNDISPGPDSRDVAIIVRQTDNYLLYAAETRPLEPWGCPGSR